MASKRWLRVEITPWRDPGGEVGGLLFMSVDVTTTIGALEEAKRSEERLKLALEIGELRMWDMDLKRRTLNNGGYRVGGNNSTYEELDEDIWRAVHPADRPAAQAAWDDYLETGAPFRQVYRLMQPDGPHQWHYSATEAVRDHDGAVTRVVGVLRNIDQQKRSRDGAAEGQGGGRRPPTPPRASSWPI